MAEFTRQSQWTYIAPAVTAGVGGRVRAATHSIARYESSPRAPRVAVGLLLDERLLLGYVQLIFADGRW